MTRKDLVTLLGITAAVALLLYVLGIGCPVLFFTGIPCFGCGMSRACLALLRLDFAEAWRYHPMVFLLPPAALVLCFYHKLPKRLLRVLGIVFSVLFMIVYLVRLVSGSLRDVLCQALVTRNVW